MKLSIVITTRNRKKNLIRCIDSVKNSEIPCDWELLIVDDNSNDGTESLKMGDLGLERGKIIHNEKQKMMVTSRNIGAKNSSGDYILFIDDDNVVSQEMIKHLLTFANNNKHFGIIGPSMYYFGSKEKYLDFQTISFFTGKTTGHIAGNSEKFFESDGIPNVFMIRKKCLEDCGYFDEGLIQTFTEPDFSFRAGKKGYRTAVIPQAKTYHDVMTESSFTPRVLGGQFSQKAYCLMRNRTIIVRRYGNFWQKMVYFLFFSCFWPMAYSILMLRYKRWDLMRLYWLGWKDGMTYFLTGKIKNSLP